MKADYLVEYRMYNNAIQEYATLLKNRNPGKMGVQFYAAVYANLASAYARLFLFEEAADCLWKSYETVRSNEIYRRYLATISLFLSREDYEKRLDELKVPKVQREKIEAWLKECRALPEEPETDEKERWKAVQTFLEEEKLAYHKSTCAS